MQTSLLDKRVILSKNKYRQHYSRKIGKKKLIWSTKTSAQINKQCKIRFDPTEKRSNKDYEL